MLPFDFSVMALVGFNKNLPGVWIVERTGIPLRGNGVWQLG